MDKARHLLDKMIKKDTPKFSIGDVVKVDVKIIEGEKQRTQPFEGTVIARKGSGTSETFTVRRISYGEGVERTFFLHSPSVDKIEIMRTGKVNRAKLYYLRKKVGKKTKIEEKVIQEEKPSDAALGEKGQAPGI
jgi:large subunit ribosomal protein L19